MLMRILEIVFPIFAVIIAGLAYGHRYKPDMAVLNRINVDVLVPCLMFSVLTQLDTGSGNYLSLALGAFIIVLLSGLLGLPVARLCGVPAKTLCPPLMFRNAGNMGLPLMVLAFGEAALPAAIIVFVVENTAHFLLGTWILSPRTHLLKILLTPLILVNIVALSINFSGIEIPQTLLFPIDMLGKACVPLLLFSLGVRLIDVDLSEWKTGMLVGILSPLSGVGIALLIMPWLELGRLEQGVLFMFGALPPAVLNFIFAERYQQEPARVASMVLIGNAVSVLSISAALAYALPRFA
jgi:hypothetical protein